MGRARSRARRRVLVIGAGPGQLGLLRAARARGLFVVACDRDPEAFAFAYANRRALLSTEDEAGIEELARRERVDGVIAPGIDWPVAIAARVAARIGLPHPIDPETAAAAVSKRRQRELFSEHRVPQPRWRIARTARAHVEVPCVVKPPDRQGQIGVSVVRDRSRVAEALRGALDVSRSGEALLEELVEGPELTVNGFSVAGRFHALTVTDRVTAEPPAFGVALAHVWPSTHATTAVADVARRAAEALAVRDGPTYTQVRLDATGPKVIELAARLGGGHDADLCNAALGVDLNGLALAASLGERPSVPARKPAGGACVRFLVAPPGQLRAVDGVARARAAKGVLDAVVYRRPPWRFPPLKRGSDRAGFVLARGDSRADALERAARAADLIRFHVNADDVP